MKKRVLPIVVLMALLVAPAATASGSMTTVSNPFDALYSWVVSLWDTWTASGDDRSPSGESVTGDEDDEDPSLVSIGPWLDPHG